MAENKMASTPMIGIVGWSGSGKTTLLEYVVAQLVARGLRVNVIKHSHHDLILEPPHKDSARLRAAGALEVMVASPYRYAIVHELRGASEPTLAEQADRLAPADVILVEGFKLDPLPKLEVYRPALGQGALYVRDSHIVAVASDVPAPADLPPHVCWLNLNDPAAVLAWFVQQLKQA